MGSLKKLNKIGWYEQEIEEKEKKIKEFRKEIESLIDKKADFIFEHCQYKDKDNNKCLYCDEDLDLGDCRDCSYHLDIGQIKRG